MSDAALKVLPPTKATDGTESEARAYNVRTWVFHPSGLKVELSEWVRDPEGAMTWTNAVIAAGWQIAPPGQQPDEESEVIGAVARTETSKGATAIHLYSASEALQWKWHTLYMDNDQLVADFLRASGFKAISDIPLYEADGAPQRGGKSAKYIIPTRQQFKAVRRDTGRRKDVNNPSTGETVSKPVYEFMRFVVVEPVNHTRAPQPTGGNDDNAGREAWETATWNKKLIGELITKWQGKHTAAELAKMLGISKWSEWTQGAKAADEKIELANVPF